MASRRHVTLKTLLVHYITLHLFQIPAHHSVRTLPSPSISAKDAAQTIFGAIFMSDVPLRNHCFSVVSNQWRCLVHLCRTNPMICLISSLKRTHISPPICINIHMNSKQNHLLLSHLALVRKIKWLLFEHIPQITVLFTRGTYLLSQQIQISVLCLLSIAAYYDMFFYSLGLLTHNVGQEVMNTWIPMVLSKGKRLSFKCLPGAFMWVRNSLVVKLVPSSKKKPKQKKQNTTPFKNPFREITIGIFILLCSLIIAMW